MRHTMEVLMHVANLILKSSMREEHYVMLEFMFRSLVLNRF